MVHRFAPFRFYPMLCVLVLACGVATIGWAAEPNRIRVIPRDIDDILPNPGMGWETFHHTADRDRNLPDWIPSTVHYVRWGWRDLEPRPGSLNEELLDDVLRQTREAGQRLAFRVMCCSTTPANPYHPEWLREIGGRIVAVRYQGRGPLEIPDLDDPATLQAHLDFIRRLGKKYDGNPDIDHIDLGSVGWWGEWHLSATEGLSMPSPENLRKVIDTYLEAFRNTPLLMLMDGPEMLGYAVGKGTGWRADCLGDMGGFTRNWCHMRNAYPQTLTGAKALEAWKTAPVAWETCWDIRKWVQEGWSLRYIFDYALALHASYINNKSAPLPDDPAVHEEIRRFLRRLGYRLVLREWVHASTAIAGDSVTIRMTWQNVGSAPCYRPYPVAIRLRNEQGVQHICVTEFTVNCLMPGTVVPFTDDFMKQPPELPPGEPLTMEIGIPLPATLPPGDYEVSAAVLDEQSRVPTVRLAIAGRESDGWYPLSRLSVRQGR
ncbi:MAG: DUF4832 domain-containing protein [Thermogutta sp.]